MCDGVRSVESQISMFSLMYAGLIAEMAEIGLARRVELEFRFQHLRVFSDR